MNRKQLEAYLLSFDNSWLDFPFGEDTSVYKVGDKAAGDGKIFAIVQDKTNPLQLSLKCDPQLAELLRSKYETVLGGYHLNKKHWNTILLTGQVPDEELQSLAYLSYQLVSKTLN